MSTWVIALLAAIVMVAATLAPDLDDRKCFEDEAVVILVQTWTGTHHEVASATGSLYCAPVDDLRVVE